MIRMVGASFDSVTVIATVEPERMLCEFHGSAEPDAGQRAERALQRREALSDQPAELAETQRDVHKIERDGWIHQTGLTSDRMPNAPAAVSPTLSAFCT